MAWTDCKHFGIRNLSEHSEKRFRILPTRQRLMPKCFFDLLVVKHNPLAGADLVLQGIKRAHSGAGLGVGMVLIPQIMGPQGQAQASTAPLTICPNCHTYIPATAKFCPECGTPLKPPTNATLICPKCGRSIPSSSKFCPECGIQLSLRTN